MGVLVTGALPGRAGHTVNAGARPAVPATEPPPTTGGYVWGRYSAEVARVTATYGKGPEREAVMRDGIFFLFHEHATQQELDGHETDMSLPLIRAYDAQGRLLFENRNRLPATKGACLVDQAGKPVAWWPPSKAVPTDLSACKPAIPWHATQHGAG